MANENQRIGNNGGISLIVGGCSPEIGNHGLELLPGGKPKEYLKSTDCSLDIQINIEKFGKVLQDGLDNTAEMADKWGWKNNHNELNWRDTPCSLRISYDPGIQTLKIQVWNELIQTWARLSLSKQEILKIMEG